MQCHRHNGLGVIKRPTQEIRAEQVDKEQRLVYARLSLMRTFGRVLAQKNVPLMTKLCIVYHKPVLLFSLIGRLGMRIK